MVGVVDLWRPERHFNSFFIFCPLADFSGPAGMSFYRLVSVLTPTPENSPSSIQRNRIENIRERPPYIA